jgi:hypothetical protein
MFTRISESLHTEHVNITRNIKMFTRNCETLHSDSLFMFMLQSAEEPSHVYTY